MPEDKKIHRPARRWARRLVRCVVWTAILGVVLLAGGLWLLQQPFCREWIQQRLNEQVDGNITFESVGLSWNGALKLNGIEYSLDANGATYQLSAQSLQLDDVLFGRAYLSLRNVGTRFGDAQVWSASRGVVAWPEPISGEPFAITFHQASLDLPAVIHSFSSDVSASTSSSTSIASPTMRVEILNSSVRLPWKTPAYEWSASFDLAENVKRVSGLLHVSPPGRTTSNRVSVSVDAAPLTAKVNAIHLQSESFPFSLFEPVIVEGVIGGDMRFEPLAAGGYRAFGQVVADKAFVEAPSAASFLTDNASATLQAQLSATYALRSMETKLQHAPITIDLASSDVLLMPTGQATLSVTRANTKNPTVNLNWVSKEIGELSSLSHEWPPAATGQYALQFSLPSKSVDMVRGYLPGWINEWVPDVKGTISLSGKGILDQQTVANLDIQAELLQAQYEVAGVNIEAERLSGPVKMDAAKATAKIGGKGSIRYPLSATQIIELPVAPKVMDFQYDRKSGDWTFRVPAFDAPPLHDLTIEAKTDGQWTASARMDVTEALLALLPMLAPDATRALEGMGGLVLLASGDATRASVRATSPDLALFSFDGEPALGVQLRDVDLRYQWESNDSGGASHVVLRAATPYFSFSGNDIEWPGQSITLEWGKPSASWDEWEVSFFPPGGGIARFDHLADGTCRAIAETLNLEAFVVPLFNRLFMEESGDETPLISAKGSINGDWRFESLSPLVMSGLLSLREAELDLNMHPAFHIEGASISAPIVYPIDYDRLPDHEIHFEAAKVAINEASFQQVAAVIPIMPSKISVLDSVMMPMYGGRTALNDLQIFDWQTNTPLISGGIQFDDLRLEQASKAFPFLPSQGRLNGRLNSIRLSGEVLEATGVLEAKVFGGTMTMNDFSLGRTSIRTPLWKMDVEFKKLDLAKITQYFDYGKMTGQISGSFADFELMLPEQAGQWPYPRRFDISIRDDMRGMGMVSKDTLQKIINLGESSGLKKLVADRDMYLFSKLGLHAKLDGNDLRLYGTLRDNLFLETNEVNVAVRRLFNPSEWFAIPVNINLAKPEDVIPFDRLWQRLMSQIEGEPAP